jgi:hypothetical protein
MPNCGFHRHLGVLLLEDHWKRKFTQSWPCISVWHGWLPIICTIRHLIIAAWHEHSIKQQQANVGSGKVIEYKPSMEPGFQPLSNQKEVSSTIIISFTSAVAHSRLFASNLSRNSSLTSRRIGRGLSESPCLFGWILLLDNDMKLAKKLFFKAIQSWTRQDMGVHDWLSENGAELREWKDAQAKGETTRSLRWRQRLKDMHHACTSVDANHTKQTSKGGKSKARLTSLYRSFVPDCERSNCERAARTSQKGRVRVSDQTDWWELEPFSFLLGCKYNQPVSPTCQYFPVQSDAYNL